MSVNLNIQVPPMREFKNVSLLKMKEKLYGANGENNKNAEITNDAKITDEENVKQNDYYYNRWIRILAAAIFACAAIPFITWILERLNKLVRAAKNLENAFLA